MKRLIPIGVFLSVLAVGFSGRVSADELKPLTKAQVCLATEDAQVAAGYKLTLVALKPIADRHVLIKFENFSSSPWNNKIILHTMQGRSDDGDLVFISDELKRPTIDKKGAVRPKGATEDVRMSCHFVEKDVVNPVDVINAYQSAAK